MHFFQEQKQHRIKVAFVIRINVSEYVIIDSLTYEMWLIDQFELMRFFLLSQQRNCFNFRFQHSNMHFLFHQFDMLFALTLNTLNELQRHLYTT